MSFCAWEPEGKIFPWAERLTAGARRSRDQKGLVNRTGGPLRIVGFSAIEMSTPTHEFGMEIWRTLTRSKGKQLALTPEIVLHLVPGTHHKIRSLTFEVKSLEAPRTFPVSKNLLGALSAKELTVAMHAISGLKFRVLKARSSHTELTN